MSYYLTGTVSCTNGSPTITGTGTAWNGLVQPGDLFIGPDNAPYPVASVVSDTQITLAWAYASSTQSGASYGIVYTQGRTVSLTASVAQLLQDYQDVYNNAGQGKFAPGTVGAPGVRGNADSDTGLAWLASNILSLIAGGNEILKVKTTGAVLSGLLTGTAVQQSKADATDGRLLTVGAFGLGGLLPELTNLDVTDNSIAPGFYLATGATATGVPVAVGYYVVQHSRRSAAGGERQIAWHETYDRVYTRSRVTGAWGAWKEILTDQSIDGDINANGVYLRLPTGQQICWKRLTFTAQGFTTAYGSQFRSANLIAGANSYAAEFVDIPSCVITASVTTAVAQTAVGGNGTATSTPTSIFAVLPSSATNMTINLNITATGRWF